MIGAYKGNAQWIGAMKDWKGAKVESGTGLVLSMKPGGENPVPLLNVQ